MAVATKETQVIAKGTGASKTFLCGRWVLQKTSTWCCSGRAALALKPTALPREREHTSGFLMPGNKHVKSH